MTNEQKEKIIGFVLSTASWTDRINSLSDSPEKEALNLDFEKKCAAFDRLPLGVRVWAIAQATLRKQKKDKLDKRILSKDVYVVSDTQAKVSGNMNVVSVQELKRIGGFQPEEAVAIMESKRLLSDAGFAPEFLGRSDYVPEHRRC